MSNRSQFSPKGVDLLVIIIAVVIAGMASKTVEDQYVPPEKPSVGVTNVTLRTNISLQVERPFETNHSYGR